LPHIFQASEIIKLASRINMSTQTKKDLVKEVSARTGLDIQTVRDNIQCMFDTMCGGLGDDGNIEIRNFGIFKVKSIPARSARNPKTGETIQVPAKRLIHFKPGQLMKQRINHETQMVPQPEPVRAPVMEAPPPQPKKEERPKRPKPVSRDRAQPAIILLPRPAND
jgi:nucleoid DNA-binding protein